MHGFRSALVNLVGPDPALMRPAVEEVDGVLNLRFDKTNVQSAMRLEEGETRYYSEDFRKNELVLVDAVNPDRLDAASKDLGDVSGCVNTQAKRAGHQSAQRDAKRHDWLRIPETQWDSGIGMLWRLALNAIERLVLLCHKRNLGLT